MAVVNKIIGLPKVTANIERQTVKMGLRVSIALRRAGLKLQRESQKLVPVDTGNLKASAFTRAKGVGFSTVVNVGYTASYAIFVHENVEMKLKGRPRVGGKGRYWDPQGRGQAKFLEEPARRMRPELLRSIQNILKI